MSLLGDTVDAFIVSLDSIFLILSSILGVIVELISGLLNLLTILVSFLYYIYIFLDVVGRVLFNPLPLFIILVGTGCYYSAFMARTRKDMLVKLGVYWLYILESAAKVFMAAFTIVARLITGIIDMI